MDCAATPALPDADNGRSNPTLTCPVPATAGCWGGPAGAGFSELANGLENCCMPAQADSRGAPSKRPIAARRVAPEICAAEVSVLGLTGPAIVSLRRICWNVSLGLDRRTSARAPPLRETREGIQAYCRRIVNQNKRIMAAPSGAKVVKKSSENNLFTVERRMNDAPGWQQLWRRGYLPSKLAQ